MKRYFKLTLTFLLITQSLISLKAQDTLTFFLDEDFMKVPEEFKVFTRLAYQKDTLWHTADYSFDSSIYMTGNYTSIAFDIKQGYFTRYYKNLQKASQGNYRNNLQVGLWKYYYENGNLKYKGYFNNGIMQGTWKIYHKDGSKKAEGHYISDFREGIWTEWYPSGILKDTLFYRKGKIEGKYLIYHDTTGTIWKSGTCKNGVLEGLMKIHYQNEALKEVGFYQNGKKTGTWKSYYLDGKLKSKGDFENGKKNGTWEWYFENGQVSSQEIYSNDSLMSFTFRNEKGKKIRNPIYSSMPQFKGGIGALMGYINSNMNYPEEAKNKGISGTVLVTFVVDEKGKVSSCKVLSSPDQSLSEEAIRLINNMPDWEPGRKHNLPFKVSFNIPVEFH